ncbi:MAG: universal stress protein [Verrucomicrobiota bacterium]
MDLHSVDCGGEGGEAGVVMKTIVAAIDFSDASGLVLRQAEELVGALEARLILVHVVQDFANFYDIYGYSIPEVQGYEEEARRRAEASLGEKAKTLALGEEGVECRVLEGNVVKELVGLVEEEGGEMLILGTHGHGVIGRVLLGSTAERIARQCPAPVLLVPAGRG